MYAIFQNGSKQYLVKEGQTIRLEKLNTAIGEIVEFTNVILIKDDKELKIGMSSIIGSLVKAKVISHGREKKIKIIKFQRRKHYRKQQGHRQWFTDVKIFSIVIPKNLE